MQNKEIASAFSLLGKLLEVHGENAFKTRSYSNAAFQIKRLDQPLAEMESAEIASLKGIGKAIHGKIMELLTNGEMNTLNRWLSETPEGIIEMLSIKGLGAKKIGLIWKELGIETPGELLYACGENRLAMLKGFGAKTQDNFAEAIRYYLANQGQFHYASAEAPALELLEKIRAKGVRAELAGAVRRKEPTLSSIDILSSEAVSGLLQEEQAIESGIRGSWNGIHTKITYSENFERDWFEQSAAPAHIELLEKAGFNLEAGDEKAIYASAGLPWIPPQMREGIGEQTLISAQFKLIEDSDIKGVVHSHSTWSDGGATIESMAKACIARGYEYLVLTDHSKSAVYAGGLTVQAVKKQHEEIDLLNAALAPFRIFKSIESDILSDGSLDYDEEVLASFDMVIASVHSGLKMDEARATERLIKAVSNPYTTVIGHPTGRLLLSRPGYPVDYKALIDACAANKVVLELNANPNRLDADYRWIPYAIKKGVKVSVNPDAHSIAGIDDIHWGVAAAQKGGLQVADCWNTAPLAAFEAWLESRKVTS